MAYTEFKNTVSHIPKLMKLLPVSAETVPAEEKKESVLMNFEPNEEEAISLLIPKYMTSICTALLWRRLQARTAPVCRRWTLQQTMQKRLLMIWN